MHFRAERHAQMGAALVVDLEINANCVGALLVLANVFEIEFFAGSRLLFWCAVGIGDERFAPLHLRQMSRKDR